MTSENTLYLAAWCNDVDPDLFRAIGSAPESSSACTTIGDRLRPAAWCRGVARLAPSVRIGTGIY